MSKTALITGATSGIGKATAYEIAKQNIRLVLCGRRQERLEALQAEGIANLLIIYNCSRKWHYYKKEQTLKQEKPLKNSGFFLLTCV